MSHYRRLVVPGGTYFFTVRLQDRSSDLLVRRVPLLRHCVRLSLQRWPFHIDAAVVLPGHLHMIWTLPPDDCDFSKRWRLIKSTFSRHVDPPDTVQPSLARRREKGIWQRRFREHLISDEADFEAHRDYIHSAPVRAGLVARPVGWALSSVHHKDGGERLNPKLRRSVYGPGVAHIN